MNNAVLIQCAKDMKLDLTQQDLAQKPEFKCLFKCMFEKEGLLKDGQFLVDLIIKSIQTHTNLDAATKDKLSKAVPTCLDSVKSTSDICVKSYDFTVCSHKVE